MAANKEYAKTYRWLTQVFHGNAPLKLELRKMADGHDSAGVVDSWDHERWEKWSPHETADSIIEAAADDAKAFKGMQAYVILCYREKREEHTNRHVFHVKGTRFDDGMEESEPPTEKGYTSQMMRHNENTQRLALETLRRSVDMIIGQNSELLKTITEMRGREFDVITLIQTLMDKKQERDVSMMKEKNTEGMRQDFMGMFKRLVPMMGMKALPENSTFEQMTIEAFLETLGTDQIDKMMTILNKEQISCLFKVIKSKGADKEAMMKMMATLDDGQYAGLMNCLRPDQQGVLGEWFMKQMEDMKKMEAEAASKAGSHGGTNGAPNGVS